jgi:hypothetical protein
MIVENEANDRLWRIVGVDVLEQLNELGATVPILDSLEDMTGVQINASQNRDGAMANVLVIAPEGGRFVRHRRQVRRRQPQRLNTWLLVDAHGVDRIWTRIMNSPLPVQSHILINHQNLLHLPIEIRVAPFQVIADLVRLDLPLVENPPDGTLARLRQTRMASLLGMARDKFRQRRNRPHFRCPSMIFRFGTGQTDHPGLGLLANLRLMRAMIGILQPSRHTFGQGFVDTLVHRRTSHSHSAHDLSNRPVLRVRQKNLRPLGFTYRRRSRPGQIPEHLLFRRRHCQCRPTRLSGHDHTSHRKGLKSCHYH